MNNRIKKLREALVNDNGKKLTQAQFAEKLRKTTNYIYMLESGNVAVTDNIIFEICRTFDVNEDWLRTGKGDMFKPKDRETEVAEIAKKLLKAEPDDYVAKLIKSLALLDLDGWRELNKIINKLVKEQEKDSSNN